MSSIRFKEIAVFIIIVLLFAGCQKPPSKEKVPKKIEGQAYYLDLKLATRVDRTSFASNEDIKAVVTLVNTSQKDIKISFASAQKFDLTAENNRRREVYRWSKGKGFAAVVLPATLKPKQKISQQFNFKLTKKGVYRIKGETGKFYFEGQKLASLLKTSPIVIILK